MPDEIATPAFVLRARPYGESDRIVTFITEQHGKVTGIGKGAKNSKRRFAGTLEPFVHVRVVFRQRSASDLVFLVRCELIEALRGLTLDIDRFAAGSYVLDLTDRMVLGRESGSEVYGLVREALTLLAGGASPDPLLRAVEMHLLRASGYAPVFDRCRGCGTPADTVLFLVVERGGLVCRRCVPAAPAGAARRRRDGGAPDPARDRAPRTGDGRARPRGRGTRHRGAAGLGDVRTGALARVPGAHAR